MYHEAETITLRWHLSNDKSLAASLLIVDEIWMRLRSHSVSRC